MTKTKLDKSNQISTGWNNGLCQDYNKSYISGLRPGLMHCGLLGMYLIKKRNQNEIQS